MVDISVFVQNTLEVISVRNQSDVRIEIPVKMVLLVTVCPEAVQRSLLAHWLNCQPEISESCVGSFVVHVVPSAQHT